MKIILTGALGNEVGQGYRLQLIDNAWLENCLHEFLRLYSQEKKICIVSTIDKRMQKISREAFFLAFLEKWGEGDSLVVK